MTHCRRCDSPALFARGLCRACWTKGNERKRRMPREETMEEVEAVIRSVKAEGKPAWWDLNGAHDGENDPPIYTPRVVRLRGRRGGVKAS